VKSQSCRKTRAIFRVLFGLALIIAKPVWAFTQDVSPVVQIYQEPSAFAGQDQVVVVGEPVEFFGSGSSPDDEIVEYAWDFESDGVQDFVSTQTGFTTHQFNLPGDYQCVLTVKDSGGRVAQDSRRIIVVTKKVTPDAAKQMLYPFAPVLSNPPDGNKRRYAVMLNGSYEERFWTDVKLAYDMLINGYGFSPADVYLLNSNGTDPGGGNPGWMIDYSAVYANIQKVFNELATRVDGDDEVFIWITGHGYGYNGPLSEGGKYYGYCSGRISVDPGDEPDFLESDFKLRSLFTGGDYRCNHGMNVWKVRKQYSSGSKTEFYRNKFVSTLDNVYIEDPNTTVSDSDIYIERLVDYALGDTNRDGYIDTSTGEVYDFDGDGRQPYNPGTDEFDEDDWGAVDKLEDNYNNAPCMLPEGGYPWQLFDEGLKGKICIDLGYTGGEPQVDGRDEDNAGLFDWMDVNGDGDTNDIVSVDESIQLAMGDIYDDDIADLVNQLSAARITIVALPCFSGGLIEDLTSPTRVICTATIEEAVSWGNLFIRNFVAALHGRNEYGGTVNADTNQNGFISMLEAFNYAAKNDYYDEIPQYDDNADGVSHTEPVPAGGDGTLGCQTHLVELIVGDFDGDGDVDFVDYIRLAERWLQTGCGGCSGADLTCDGNVDLFDLQEFTYNWLAGIDN
jgi:PKD repeat protein